MHPKYQYLWHIKSFWGHTLKRLNFQTLLWGKRNIYLCFLNLVLSGILQTLFLQKNYGIQINITILVSIFAVWHRMISNDASILYANSLIIT